MNSHLSWDIFRNSFLLYVFIVTRYPNNTNNFRSHSHTHTYTHHPPSLAGGLLRTPADRPRIPPGCRLYRAPQRRLQTAFIWRTRWPLVSARCALPLTKDNLAGVLSLFCFFQTKDKGREHKYEALSPSTDSPATRRASHGTPTWATRGARAASLRVTWTSCHRAARVVSGGKLRQNTWYKMPVNVRLPPAGASRVASR